jgi:hypothetical protein
MQLTPVDHLESLIFPKITPESPGFRLSIVTTPSVD